MGLAQKVAVNSASQAASQLFAALAGILSVGIAARYLSVNEYGEVVTAVVLTSLLYFAADFGITPTAARMVAREGADEARILSGAFWAGVMFNLATVVGIFVLSQGIYSGTDDSTTRIAVVILLSSYLLKPWAGVTRAKAIVEQRQYLMSLANVLSRVVSLVVLVVAVLFDLGPIAVAIGFATGMVMEDVFALTLLRPRLGAVPDRQGGRIREVVGAAVPLGTILVVNGLYFKTPALLLSVLATDRDVALYGVAYKAFEVLFALPSFVMVTLLPELARLDAGEPRFNAIVQKAFTAMTLLSLPIVGMALCGTEMMEVLGGSQYGAGGRAARVHPRGRDPRLRAGRLRLHARLPGPPGRAAEGLAHRPRGERRDEPHPHPDARPDGRRHRAAVERGHVDHADDARLPRRSPPCPACRCPRRPRSRSARCSRRRRSGCSSTRRSSASSSRASPG